MSCGVNKKQTIGVALVLMVTFGLMMHQPIQAERSLFIGDVIQLEIESATISKDELQTQLDGFEIVDFTSEQGKTTVTLRCLEIGTRSIKIEGQEIEITVASALEEVQRDTIYEFMPELVQPKLAIPWLMVELIFIAIFLICTIILSVSYLKNKKKKNQTAFEVCLNALNSIDVLDPHCLARMTMEVKFYLQKEFGIALIGKTTDEFKLKCVELTLHEETKTQLNAWLNESDYYKFSGIEVPFDKKEIMKETLIQMVKAIDHDKKDTTSKEVAT
jgi:hypothetical protein